MDPIEINAGTYYLRQLRADDLLDDRIILRANGFPDPDAHIAARADGWRADTEYTWAIAEPTTGALLGEVGLTELHGDAARAICWIAPEHQCAGIARTALGSVLRFGFGALALRTVDWTHSIGDAAAERVAIGFGWTRISESAGQLLWRATA
ncbi:MAG TPA: GNAT family N-acetyltransferase [Pseudonocardiaceae bacterium]